MILKAQEQTYLELPKVKEPMIISALDGIDQTFDGIELYPTLCDKAVHILRTIQASQAFPDGNKRVALATFEIFLHMNSSSVTNISQKTKELFVLGIANNRITKEQSVKCCIKGIRS